MPDPTRVHAYLARTKDQEKDVIAMPDGAGGALCVSFDKHWTYSRPWDMLHIIAPLVKDEGNDDPSEAHRLERQAATISELQGSFLRVERERDEWRRAHAIVEAERDQARDERDQYRRSGDEWRECHADAVRERDEWRARAEAAEARTAAHVLWQEDPIMVRTRELLDLACPGEYAWTGAFETCRKIAEAEARLEES